MQRILLRLEKYDIKLTYRQGKHLKVACTSSRTQVSKTAEEISDQEMAAQIHLFCANLPCSNDILEEVRKDEKVDPIMQKIIQMQQKGWPQSKKILPENFKFCNYKTELSEYEGIILKDQRILIPLTMREIILEKLHQGHQGIEKTKQRARETDFWPGIKSDRNEDI